MNDQQEAGRYRGGTPPPEGFDPVTAARADLARYGLPQRPDPQHQPGLATLWDVQARRYRTFDHLTAEVPRRPPEPPGPAPEPRGLYPVVTCGYELNSFGDPFTAFFVTWTVPNLRYTPSPLPPNQLRTFVSLGFLDVHVNMTVDPAGEVSAGISATGVGGVGLPVRPGDVLSAAMCLGTEPPGRATYVLANETSAQTVNFSFDSGWPPATTVVAGVARDAGDHPSRNPLARFGVVYFDEISVYATSGSRSLTDGQAVTMVDLDGATLARPVRLNDFAFKTVHVE